MIQLEQGIDCGDGLVVRGVLGGQTQQHALRIVADQDHGGERVLLEERRQGIEQFERGTSIRVAECREPPGQLRGADTHRGVLQLRLL
jgi:hypothetical protein